MTPGLVIFDCDGVLVDTEHTTNTVISQNLARYGLAITPKDCLSLFVGGTMEAAGHQAQRLGADLPENWLSEIYSEMFAVLKQGVAVIDGVVAVLDRLEALGVATCVASNGPENKMDVTLAPSGLLKRFEGRIFSAHRYDTAKPEPELLLIAARHMGVSPEQCVMIDDSPAGVIAAKRAGMRAIGYDDQDDAQRLEKHGAEVISHMAELLPLLGFRPQVG
jgi:HAD superfamily hydrolase (TIGR01509 family)